jgi:septal ring factor EnvC (AmiA/AmiB activator)
MTRYPTLAWRSALSSLARRASVGLLALVSILALTGEAGLATAAEISPAAAQGSAQASRTDASREYWQKRYRNLQTLVASLELELEQARASYSRMRHERRLRGETRTELLEEIAQLEKRLAKARSDLEEFPERARAAGALPGWFRD